ncbi:hypothetical protein [Azohydromonas caseinilytica]|uniref:Amino acid transporter n=1 Tax=Azohydromonas caseinilytica TaxID=2728836 RepID=A0A848F7S5_9BURK|nr:hypothetical protein [Azohydromonas caseinilytica]NML15228.1 hypothetical protein [Azohydromonas caseinilytica]
MSELIDLLQWPAMVATLVASWMVGSQRKYKRNWGFWLFILSNVLWFVWGWQNHAWALITLQVGLFVLNLRGARKNDPEKIPEQGEARQGARVGQPASSP